MPEPSMPMQPLAWVASAAGRAGYTETARDPIGPRDTGFSELTAAAGEKLG